MGIERFFKNLPKIKIINYEKNVVTNAEDKIKTDNLYIDFNSIIHGVSFKVQYDINYYIYWKLKNILNNSNENHHKINDICKKYNFNDVCYYENNLTSANKIIENILFFSKSLKANNFIKIDKIIINEVVNYFFNLLETHFECDKVKHLYVAVDGTPYKSKISEQKKRRYLGGIMKEVKDRLYIEHSEEIKKTGELRFFYEENKIEWNKSKIGVGTEFMNILDDNFSGKLFLSKLNKICNNLNQYVYSGSTEYGEGENKIINNIRNISGTLDSCTIFSPDGDVILWSLSLTCKMGDNNVNNVKILRLDPQEQIYNIIDLDALSNNLYSYVNDKIKKNIDHITKDNIVDDFIFLMTFFGNDFVSKVETFDIRYDLDFVMDKYIEAIIKHNKALSSNIFDPNSKYDIFKMPNKKKINFEVLKTLITELQEKEKENLNKLFMSNNFHNYDKIKNILDVDHSKFIIELNHFLIDLDKLEYLIYSKHNYASKEVEWKSNKFIKTIKNYVKDSKNKIFFDDKYVMNKSNLKVVFELKKKLILSKKEKSINSPFLKKKFENSMSHIDKNIKLTKFDEEIFKMDNMLDEYSYIFNHSNFKFGDIEYHNKLKYKMTDANQSVNHFYKNFKIEKLVDDYMDSLIWIFNNYFNYINDQNYSSQSNLWFYPHSESPLLKHIVEHMDRYDQDYMDMRANYLYNLRIENNLYLNPTHHLLYTLPIQFSKKILPEEFKPLIKNKTFNENVFPHELKYFFENLNPIIDKIIDKKNSDKINCAGKLFISKCEVDVKMMFSNEDDIKFKKIIDEFKLTTNAE